MIADITYIACKHCHQPFEGRGRRARRNWHQKYCDDMAWFNLVPKHMPRKRRARKKLSEWLSRAMHTIKPTVDKRAYDMINDMMLYGRHKAPVVTYGKPVSPEPFDHELVIEALAELPDNPVTVYGEGIASTVLDDRNLGRIANIDTKNGATFNADDVIEALNHMKRRSRLIEPIPIHKYPPCEDEK